MKNLVFLISQPRSGSTLLQVLLGQHPEIATTSEPWINLPYIYSLNGNSIYSPHNSQLSTRAIKDFLHQIHISESEYKNRLGYFLNSFYQRYLESENKKIFLDKTPRYYEIVDDLAEIYPDARFILLHRNPLDVLRSIYNTWIKGKDLFLACYSKDLFTGIIKILNFEKRFPERCRIVYYENLIKNPSLELKNICDFLGVEFDPNITRYNEAPNWNFGDKNISKFAKPTAERPNDNTFSKLPFYEKAYLKRLGKPSFESFGYDYNENLNKLSSSPISHVYKFIFDYLMFNPDFPPPRSAIEKIYSENKHKFFKLFILRYVLKNEMLFLRQQ